MPYSISKNSNEIKLYYQLYFSKNGLAPKEFQSLTFDSDVKFADDVLEDFQASAFWDEAINIAITNGQVFFNIYRDDEQAIPKNARLLSNVSVLPNNSLLGLDTAIQETLKQWIPSSVKQAASNAVDTIGAWLNDAIPSLKLNATNTWTDIDPDEWEDCIDETEEYFESEIAEKTTLENETSKKYVSLFHQAIHAAWQLASYATRNPLRAMTWMLATQVLAASAMSVGAKSTSRLSSYDAEATQPEPSHAVQLRASSAPSTHASQGFIFPAEMALSSLNGVNGFTLIGENPGDSAGYSVSNGGDVNGDGIDDMVVGAYRANNNTGVAYVIFGQKSWPATLTLSSLNGVTGCMLIGNNDFAGYSVSNAGDVNGDGIADVLISAPHAITPTVYVVFGQKNKWSATLALSSLNGASGFKLIGDADDGGASVSNAGDVNGDGITDILVGAPGANNQVGAAYVVFGQKSSWPATLLLSSLNGTNGFKLTGESAYDRAGWSVSNAGDVNGDGIADVLISAYGANSGAGAAYVVFGQKSGWPATLALSSLNGVNGFKLAGNPGDNVDAVSNAGDINGDGIADMVVNAPLSNGHPDTDYVIFGQKNGWPATLALSSLNGINGFKLTGNEGGNVGLSVCNAGDVNGDGIADIFIGIPEVGVSYVVFGQKSGWPATLPFSSLDGINGFQLVGNPGDNAGYSVSNAGDVNGDGITDMLFGAVGINNDAGGAYLVFGSRTWCWNQLIVNQNQFVLLTPENFFATYRGALLSDLYFNITALEHGQFYWTATIEPVTFFSQQNVTDGKVQFKADDSTQMPHYAVTTYLNGIPQTVPIASLIIYYLSPTPAQNNLIINQGQAVVLNQNNFDTTDVNPDITPSDITFDFFSLQHGFFSFTVFPQIPILNFSQQNIISNAVQFTHDGSIVAPSYFFTITDKYGAQSHAIAGNIDFDVNPILVRNQLRIKQAQVVTLSSDNLNATHNGIQQGSLVFNIANLAHGYFYYGSNPGVFVTSFYQDNISNSLVVFAQDGTMLAPLYQVSVSDGRINTPYQEADIIWVTPTPSPSPSPSPTPSASPSPSPTPLIPPTPSAPPGPTPSSVVSSTPVTSPLYPTQPSNSLDPTLEKGLISGGISGAVGFLFLVIRLYFAQRAQRKLNQIAEESEGVGRELIEYRNNVIRPIARAISARIKITGCLEYISDGTMSDYLNAVETLVGELSQRGIQFNFEGMPREEKHRIIHVIAQQTKQTLVPTLENNFCGNVFNFFCPKIKPDITPRDIETNVNEITERVLLVLQQGVNVTEDGSRELNALASPDSSEGDQHPEQRPLLASP